MNIQSTNEHKVCPDPDVFLQIILYDERAARRRSEQQVKKLDIEQKRETF